MPRKGTALDNLREELHRWFDEVLQMGDIDPPKLAANDILSRALFPLSDDVNVAVGDYIRTAALLGARVGEMHKLLARTDVEAFAPAPLDLAARDKIVREVLNAVGDVFALLDVRAPAQREKVQTAIAAMRAKKPIIEKRVQNLLAAPEGAVRIRIHGDYHLGQTLHTAANGGDFVLLDFEGEPARTLVERRQKQSPLKDVAGMIRSFSYAAFSALDALQGAKPDGAWALAWQNAASAAFLKRYRETLAVNPALLPPQETADKLLNGYLLEKALYELTYELNNRPAWLPIPLAGILTV